MCGLLSNLRTSLGRAEAQNGKLAWHAQKLAARRTIIHRCLNAAEDVVFGESGKNFSEIGKRRSGWQPKLSQGEADQHGSFIHRESYLEGEANANAQTWEKQFGSVGDRARLHGNELCLWPSPGQERDDFIDSGGRRARRHIL